MTTHHTTKSKHKLLLELETYAAGGVRHQQEQLQRQRKRSLSLYESTTTGDAQNGATTRRRLQEQPLTEASPEKHLEIVAVMVNHFLLNKFTKMQQYLMIQRYEMTCHVM